MGLLIEEEILKAFCENNQNNKDIESENSLKIFLVYKEFKKRQIFQYNFIIYGQTMEKYTWREEKGERKTNFRGKQGY